MKEAMLGEINCDTCGRGFYLKMSDITLDRTCAFCGSADIFHDYTHYVKITTTKRTEEGALDEDLGTI